MAGGGSGEIGPAQAKPVDFSDEELAARLKAAADQGNEDAARLLKEMQEARALAAENLEELRTSATKLLGTSPVAGQGAGGGGAAMAMTATEAKFYRVARTAATGFVDGWGLGFEPKPEGLTAVVAVSAGPRDSLPHSLALKADGTVVAWGQNIYGQTIVPAGLADVVAVAAGGRHSMALKRDGTVVMWGDDSLGQRSRMPENLSGVVDIKAGLWHSMALKADGTVAVWGDLFVGTEAVPADLNQVTAIAAGPRHCLALKSDRTVVAWGRDHRVDGYRKLNLHNFDPAFVPADLTNAVSISAGMLHNQAVRANGMVRTWGKQGNAGLAGPSGTDFVASGAGWHYGLAVTAQGDLVQWPHDFGPDGIDTVVAFSAGAAHVLVIRTSDDSLVIRRQPRDVVQAVGLSAFLTVEATSALPITYQWLKNGVEIGGATSAELTFLNLQEDDQGMYQVRLTTAGGELLSREAEVTPVDVPVIHGQSPALFIRLAQGNPDPALDSLNVVAVSTGALRYDWYHDGQPVNPGVNPITYPSLQLWSDVGNLPVRLATEGEYWVVVSSIAGYVTSEHWHVKVTLIGESTGWGQGDFGQLNSSRQETNLVAVSAGGYHTLGLRENGTVYAWGANFAQQTDVPAGLDEVIAVAAGWSHSLALKEDGTVVAWGENGLGQANVPPEAVGIIGLAAGVNHSLALKSDGTVVGWGGNSHGEINIPANLEGVTQVGAGDGLSFALLYNGTVLSWGTDGSGPVEIPQGLNNVVRIAAGYGHALALKSDGTVVGLGVDSGHMETVPPQGLDNVMGIAAGLNFSLALVNDGTVRAWGDNDLGQTEVEGITEIKMLAAGANHGVALAYSPILNYPVNVARDLLVIYNTASEDSEALEEYYLAYRPMVAEANVLGVECRQGELFLSESERNQQLVEPVLGWLSANPTLRPSYYILMYDIPSRIPDYDGPSVMVHLRNSVPGIKPYVTHLNMATLQDCQRYVDKLAAFGDAFSPGKVVISPRQGGYADLSYQLDNVHFSAALSLSPIFEAKNALLDMGVPEDSVIYTECICPLDGTQPNILLATNVAAYVSRGFHGGLGTTWAIDGRVKFFEESEWFIVQTIESFNGRWTPNSQGSFQRWFEHNSFGGTDYSHTAVGAVAHTDEPHGFGISDTSLYLTLWEKGKYFGIAAWNSRNTGKFQATGDPLITR